MFFLSEYENFDSCKKRNNEKDFRWNYDENVDSESVMGDDDIKNNTFELIVWLKTNFKSHNRNSISCLWEYDA